MTEQRAAVAHAFNHLTTEHSVLHARQRRGMLLLL
jgi:hypothetical protein